MPKPLARLVQLFRWLSQILRGRPVAIPTHSPRGSTPNPLNSPPRIFGRRTILSHGRLAGVCEAILKLRPGPNDRAFAWNLIHDHRVNEKWAEVWFNAFRRPTDEVMLRSAFRRYFRRFLTQPVEAYADLESFAESAVLPVIIGAPQPNHLLTSVIDLWSPQARNIWQFGLDNGCFIGRIPFSTRDLSSLGLPSELVSILKPGSIDGQQPLVSAFFEAQRGYLDEVERCRRRRTRLDTLNPVWVTLTDEWRKRVGRNANQWCNSLGLSRHQDGLPTWLAVVTYPMHRAKRLFRPTQLEGGWYGRHFPSPPGCPLVRGGRVVEGRESVFEKPGYRPLPEYIHHPIPLYIDDWLVMRMPVASTDAAVGDPGNLERDRTGHYHGLSNRFHDLSSWMERPNA